MEETLVIADELHELCISAEKENMSAKDIITELRILELSITDVASETLDHMLDSTKGERRRCQRNIVKKL